MAVHPLGLRWNRKGGFGQQARVIKVLAGTAFKLKYADSFLGYFWSLARPLVIFGTLYVVFGRALAFGGNVDYPLFLLIGVVLFLFFSDATTAAMTSIVVQGQLLRKLHFPRAILPISASVTSLFTFAINVVAISLFIAWRGIVPRLDWLLLPLLFVELYAFVVGVSLILTTLYARLRDVATIWELLMHISFYGLAIIYALEVLPAWGQRLMILVPFVQIMQDVREIILYRYNVTTAADVYPEFKGYVASLAIVVLTLLIGYVLFRREERWLAERI